MRMRDREREIGGMRVMTFSAIRIRSQEDRGARGKLAGGDARFDFSSGSVQLYLCTVFITSFIVFCTSHKSLVFSVILRVPAARSCLACSSSRVSRSRN